MPIPKLVESEDHVESESTQKIYVEHSFITNGWYITHSSHHVATHTYNAFARLEQLVY